MKTLTRTLITLSLGAVISNAGHAASSGNLSVIGTIKPATCVTTIGGVSDATFAYGKISPTRLLQNAMTALEAKSLPLRISCDGPTKLAVTAVDNKSGSNPFTSGTVDSSDAGESPAQTASTLYGLGTYGTENKKIGAFSLALKPTTMRLGGEPAFMAASSNNGLTWTSATAGEIGGTNKVWRTWTAVSGSKDPAQATLFEADLMVKPWIQPRSALDLSGNIALSGSATIEIKYL